MSRGDVGVTVEVAGSLLVGDVTGMTAWALAHALGAHAEAEPPPYVATMYRGVDAPIVAVLRDPGSKAGGVRGSGFLSVESDDQTAERQCRFFAAAGTKPVRLPHCTEGLVPGAAVTTPHRDGTPTRGRCSPCFGWAVRRSRPASGALRRWATPGRMDR